MNMDSCFRRNDGKRPDRASGQAMVESGMTEMGSDCGSSLFPLSFRTDVRNLQLEMMNAFGMDDLDDLEAAAGGGRKLRARIYSGGRCKTRGDFSSLRSSE